MKHNTKFFDYFRNNLLFYGLKWLEFLYKEIERIQKYKSFFLSYSVSSTYLSNVSKPKRNIRRASFNIFIRSGNIHRNKYLPRQTEAT